MSDDMRTRLTDFAAEFVTQAGAEQRLKEVFEKHIVIARVSKEAGNYEQLVMDTDECIAWLGENLIQNLKH